MKVIELVFQSFWSGMWAFLIVSSTMFFLSRMLQILRSRLPDKVYNETDEEEVLGLRPGYQSPVEKSELKRARKMEQLIQQANAQMFLGVEFINLVKEFRETQKKIEASRDEMVLLRCKELESKIDQQLTLLTPSSKKEVF